MALYVYQTQWLIACVSNDKIIYTTATLGIGLNVINFIYIEHSFGIESGGATIPSWFNINQHRFYIFGKGITKVNYQTGFMAQ